MRDYAKVEPKEWQGEVFKALRKRGPEALLVGLYLTTSPMSNMLGLYAQPLLYMAHETGLGEEGATKGLQGCIEVGFCSYDLESEVVWVHDMATCQIAPDLKAADLRCKGIQKQYDALPNNPFLGLFYDRYAEAFHLTARRETSNPMQGSLLAPFQAPYVAPTKPRARTGAGARTGEEPPASPPAKLPAAPIDKVIDLYHEILPGLPSVRLHTKDRVRAIRKVWDWVLTSNRADGSRRATTGDEALLWFRDYFTRATANDFLMGRGSRSADHSNWRCDLDFLLTDKGMKHVIEKTEVPA